MSKTMPFPSVDEIRAMGSVPILGQTVERTLYDVKIPNEPSRKQLAIFVAGLVRSLGVDFAFTDEEWRSIHPAIRHWFKPITVEIPDGQDEGQNQDESQDESEAENAGQ